MKWYGVKTVFYDDGSITAQMTDPMIAPAKPEDTTRQTETLDIYTEWFETRKHASKYIEDVANISTAAKHEAQLDKLRDLSKQISTLISEMEETS